MRMQCSVRPQTVLAQPQRRQPIVIAHEADLPVVAIQPVFRHAEMMGLIRVADRSRRANREFVNEAALANHGMHSQRPLEQAHAVAVIHAGAVEIQIAVRLREAVANFD